MPVQTFRDLAPDCPLATCGSWRRRFGSKGWRSRQSRYVFVSSLPSPPGLLAAPDERAPDGADRKSDDRKEEAAVPSEMVSPHEMSLVQTAFGMCAQRTRSEPLREAFVKIAEKLTNIDRMIVEEDLD